MNESRQKLLQLFHFMCAFAWADLEIQQQERDMIERLLLALELLPEDWVTVLKWLEHPPEPDAIKPYNIPADFREQIYEAAKAVVLIDGKMEPKERDMLTLLRNAFNKMQSAEIPLSQPIVKKTQ